MGFKQKGKIALLALGSLISLGIGTVALASASSGIGGVAAQVQGNLSNIALLITGGAYVAGMAFGVGAIVKFKAHKDNPQQIPIGTPIALLFVAAALLFIPSVFKASGSTLFGTSGSAAGVAGTSSF